MGQVIKDSSIESTNRRGSPAGTNDSTSIVVQARDVASQVKNQGKEMVTSTVSKRQEQSAMELTGIAEVLRRKSEDMENSLLGPMVAKAADQMDRASEYLMDAKLKDVVRSTERFARREPLFFLGGAFALGVLCARFLKSSAQHSHHDVNTGAKTGEPVQP